MRKFGKCVNIILVLTIFASSFFPAFATVEAEGIQNYIEEMQKSTSHNPIEELIQKAGFAFLRDDTPAETLPVQMENLITSVEMTDESANEYNITDNRPARGGNVLLKLNLDWSTELIPAGEYSYTLPEAIKIASNIERTIEGTNIKWSIAKGSNEIKITVPADLSNSTQTLIIDTVFYEFADSDSLEKHISFPLSDGTTKEYDVRFIANPAKNQVISISSSAEYDPASFTTTIDLNRSSANLKENHKFYIVSSFANVAALDEMSDFKLVEKAVTMDGETISVLNTLTLDEDYTVTSSNGKIVLTLLKDIDNALGFSYETKVKEEYVNDIENDAFIVRLIATAESIGELASNKIKIKHKKDSNLAKEGKQVNKNIIWNITYNLNEETIISGTTLYEEFEDTDWSKITIKTISIIRKNGLSLKDDLDNWDISKLAYEGKLIYNGEDTTDQFLITINNGFVNPESKEYTNIISDNLGNKATASVDFDAVESSKYVVEDSYNPNDNTVEWVIDVNSNFSNSVVTGFQDTYLNRITGLVESSFELRCIATKTGEEKVMIKDTDYTLTIGSDGFFVDYSAEYSVLKGYKYIATFKTTIQTDNISSEDDFVANKYEVYGIGPIPHIGEGKYQLNSLGDDAKTVIVDEEQGLINWSVFANSAQQFYDVLKVKDTMSDNQSMIKDSLKFYVLNHGTIGEEIFEGDSRYPTKIEIAEDLKSFNLEFEDIGSQSVVFQYQSKPNEFPFKMTEYKNSATLQNQSGSSKKELHAVAKIKLDAGISKFGVEDNKTPGLVNWTLETPKLSGNFLYPANSCVQDIINFAKGTEDDGTFLIQSSFKIYDENGDQLISGEDYDITFEYDPETHLTLFGKMDTNYFRIVFKKARTSSKITYQTYSSKSITLTNSVFAEVSNKYVVSSDAIVKIEKTSGSDNSQLFGDITVIKKSDFGEFLAGAEFELFDEEGFSTGLKATTDIDGQLQFKNLLSGKYLIKEITAPDGYEISDEATVGLQVETGEEYVVINISPKTSLSVQKVWDDAGNQDGVRPASIEVELYANGEATGKIVELNEANHWQHTWTALAEKKSGETISYTAKEVSEVEGYTTTIEQTGSDVTITNKHTTEEISISGKKIWSDGDDQDEKRPASITIYVWSSGEKVAEVVVTAADDWHYTVDNLPKYKNGEELTYSITEDTVPEYTAEYDGFDVTNSYTPSETSLSVQKVWDDAGNQDGVRPASIEVELYANGEATGKIVELNEANHWQHTWTALAEKKSGETISYTAKEVSEVEGYTTTVEQEGSDVTITNKHSLEPTKPSIPEIPDPEVESQPEVPNIPETIPDPKPIIPNVPTPSVPEVEIVRPPVVIPSITTEASEEKKIEVDLPEKQQLPKTGEQKNMEIIIVGILISIVCVIGLVKLTLKNKKSKHER